MFSEKHERVFAKTGASFPENTSEFFQKHNSIYILLIIRSIQKVILNWTSCNKLYGNTVGSKTQHATSLGLDSIGQILPELNHPFWLGCPEKVQDDDYFSLKLIIFAPQNEMKGTILLF